MRLFALEYFRQFIRLDLTHFYAAKKKAQLKTRNQLGPFVFNKREAWEDTDKVLGEKLKLKQSFYWASYHPDHFISYRKLKNNLTTYVHHKIPEIQQYSNQQEWVEGTLVEEITEEEKLEKAMKELEKILDLDSFGQVSFKLPQHTGGDTSFARTSQQPTQKASTGSAKGKEVIGSEQDIMTDQPATSKEQGQGQVPPTQTKAPETPALQTPLNEERGKKRDRQEDTLIGGSEEQPGEKRQILNPLSEEQFIKETTDSLREERVISQDTSPITETSASSHRQEIGRQHSVEFSSARPQSRQGSDIKKTFIEIKAKNEPIRIQLYNHLLKMAPTNQQRLMSTYEIQEGKMILNHFKPKMQQPQLVVDYIRTNLEILAKDIHPMDQIELRKQTGEMVYSTLTDKAFLAHKLQNSLNNTSTQLELEKASSLAKDNRIKSLEEIIIELGHDPKDAKGIKALIKKKEGDIAALRKQLKLPITMHPQTTEMVEQKSQEDMMDLLMKMNERLAKKEQALEKALQEKQGVSTSQPSQIAPIVTTAPTTVTTAVPPTGPTSVVGTSTTIAASSNTTISTEELIKAMEDLRLQVSELKDTKEKLAKLEISYDKFKMTMAEKQGR